MPPRSANVQRLNCEMGVVLEASGSLRCRFDERNIFHVLSVLKELDSEGEDSPSNFNFGKISGRWGFLKDKRLLLNAKCMLQSLKTVAVLEQVQSQQPSMRNTSLSAAVFEEEAAKLTGKTKYTFKSIFGFHPGLCAEVWNRTRPLKAKPKHLLGTLMILRAEDDPQFWFEKQPKLKAKWIQRILRPISAQYDFAVVSFLCSVLFKSNLGESHILLILLPDTQAKTTAANKRSNVASLSSQWKIMNHKESLCDPKVFRSIVVLNWISDEWEILNDADK